MHAWRPKWHTSIHLGLFQDLSGYFPQQEFYSAIYCAVFPFAYTFLQWGYLWPTWGWLEKHNKTEQGSFWGYFITVHNRTHWTCFNVELSLRKNCVSSRNAVRKWADGFYTNCAELRDFVFLFQFMMHIVSKQLYTIIQD